MKNYEKLQELKPEIFKRLTGVKPHTFKAKLQECELHHEKKKAKGGKPNKLSVSTQILLMLEYYREYRSMAHMAFDYEVSEATVSRVIKEIERVLLSSGKFSLPSKKALNAKIKVFKIVAQKYRNRRKKFGLRFNLICALINWDRGFAVV
jgi:predicted DNA-binding protein YlxM (UPF0122 family)